MLFRSGWKDIVRVCVGVRTLVRGIRFGSARWIVRDCMKILNDCVLMKKEKHLLGVFTMVI